ncbi:hypothetical protein D3C71_989850 [compost metagenome]
MRQLWHFLVSAPIWVSRCAQGCKNNIDALQIGFTQFRVRAAIIFFPMIGRNALTLPKCVEHGVRISAAVIVWHIGDDKHVKIRGPVRALQIAAHLAEHHRQLRIAEILVLEI